MSLGQATSAPFLEQVGPTLVAVVLTGIVGVVAAWLGRRWERWATRDAWLREQRLTAYVDFLDALRAAIDATMLAGPRLGDLDDDDLERTLAPYEVAWRALERPSAVIRVVGPDSMVNAALECITAVETLFDARITEDDHGLAASAAAWAHERGFAAKAHAELSR